MAKKTKKKILRQPLSNRIVHWGTAISIFMLIITGIGQMPVYSRYMLVQPFGTKWLTSYEITLWVHYIFAALLMFFVAYHIVYHVIRKEFAILPRKGDVKGSFLIFKAMLLRKEEPPSDKYLPEQRLAYAFFAFSIGLVIITGMIKVIKNIMGIQPTDGILLWGALLHNIAMVLIIIAIVLHLAAFIVKENRKLLPGMFTGYVDYDYVKKRHKIWYDKLMEKYRSIKEVREKKTS